MTQTKQPPENPGRFNLWYTEPVGRERETSEWNGVRCVSPLEWLAKERQEAKARRLLTRIALEHEKLGRAKVETGDVATAFPFSGLPQPKEFAAPPVVARKAREDRLDIAQPFFAAIGCPAIELEVEAHVGM